MKQTNIYFFEVTKQIAISQKLQLWFLFPTCWLVYSNLTNIFLWDITVPRCHHHIFSRSICLRLLLSFAFPTKIFRMKILCCPFRFLECLNFLFFPWPYLSFGRNHIGDPFVNFFPAPCFRDSSCYLWWPQHIFDYTAVHFLKAPPLFSDLRFLALHSTTSSLSYLVSSLVSVDSQFVFLICNSCFLVASFCLDSTLFTFLCCLAISWPHLLQCLLPSGKQGSRPSVYSACYLVQLVAGRAVAPVCTVPAT